MDLIIRGQEEKLIGEITVPGDKSISHRSIMIGALAEGITVIKNLLISEDIERTIEAFRNMGVAIEEDKNIFYIKGVGKYGLKKPQNRIDCGNSGTTVRLLSGILIGQNFTSNLVGDDSLTNRPMNRILIPLNKMGGYIKGRENKYLPLEIEPSQERLKGIEYELPVASAQVKSSILLATLYSNKPTKVIEKKITRDHTERMLKYFGCSIISENGQIYMEPNCSLKAKKVYIPGDISSAAYFIVAASLIKGSHLIIRDVGINPTRIGIIHVLQEMGANISIFNRKLITNEPVADIEVKYSKLKGIVIEESRIGTIIDEIPIIGVASSLAEGETIIKGAQELKYKESNRLMAICKELMKMGANVTELADGMIIRGKDSLNSSNLNSYNDHRIAMALSIAALKGKGESVINNHKCINISYPSFYDTLLSLCNKYKGSINNFV